MPVDYKNRPPRGVGKKTLEERERLKPIIQKADIRRLVAIQRELREVRLKADAIRDANKIYLFNQPRESEGGPKGGMPANPKQAEMLYAFGDPYQIALAEKKMSSLELLEIERRRRLLYKIFAFTGGNRSGKCLTYQTLIETPDGEIPIGELFKRGESFNVYAWDGKKRVIAKAEAPFKKEGLHQCYRITMSDGSIIEAADHHRVLTSHGWIFVDSVRASFDSLRESSSEPYPSTHVVDAFHLIHKPQDCQDDYSANHHQYDERPPSGQENDQVSSPLQGGVLQHAFAWLRLDGKDSRYTNILQRVSDLLSTLDDLLLLVGQSAVFLYRSFYKSWKQFDSCNQVVLQPIYEFSSPLQSSGGSSQWANRAFCTDHNRDYSYPAPFTGGNHIISIKPIGSQEVYDFTVHKHHNYFAGGMIHHNTVIDIILALCTLFGEWPWTCKDMEPGTGVKLKFPHNLPRKVRLIGQDWEKHITTVLIPALKEWWPKNREVLTKKNNTGVEAMWTDVMTGSTLEIMSNKQESEVYEGWNGDLVAYDEPGKREIRIANARGLVDRLGREFFGMTLLKEAWVDREVLKATNEDGTPDTTVFAVHADIYNNMGYGITKEGIEQFAKTLKADEKDARLKGIPSYMAGLVLPEFKRGLHVRQRLKKIPLDWVLDIHIDFHPSKPWAIVFKAVDSRGFHYIIDEMWESGSWKTIGEDIVRKIKRYELRVNAIIADPLMKGDPNSDLHEESVFDKMGNLFRNYGYMLNTASKDKEGGIHIIQDLLLTENEVPALFVFDNCKRMVYEMEGWMYDEHGKPQKKDDDMVEGLYRLCLLDTQYVPLDDEDYVEDSGPAGNPITGY